MGPKDAILAAKFLKRKVIPVHYNTWPVISQNPEEFKKAAARENVSVVVVKPGESVEL